jgi:hypothetical protein
MNQKRLINNLLTSKLIADAGDLLNSNLITEAIRIVNKAKENNVILRIMGAVAIMIKCKEHLYLYNGLKRELTDIDFAGYSNQGSKISGLLRELGYEMRKDLLIHEGRYFFHDPKTKLKIDVFLDKLSMNHIINFRNRLELDFPTLTLADLVLEKLQIVRITEKDLKDLVVLFHSYDVGYNEKVINAKYIATLLAKDWGFYYTVTINLNKLKLFLEKLRLFDVHKKDIEKRISSLREIIEKEPKSTKWSLRAKIGPRAKWYTEVEETSR